MLNLGRVRWFEVPSDQHPRLTQPATLMLSLLGVGAGEGVVEVELVVVDVVAAVVVLDVVAAVVVLDVVAAVVVLEVVAAVVVLELLVVDEAATVELEVVDDDTGAVAIFWYKFSLLLPPQVSVALPTQAMLLMTQLPPYHKQSP